MRWRKWTSAREGRHEHDDEGTERGAASAQADAAGGAPDDARAGRAGLGEDAIAHVKFFSPFGRGTWYFTEFDGEDTLFGYCVSPLGPDCDEWGYSSLNEIAEATVFGSVPAIERDCYWRTRTVREAIKSNGTD